MANSSTVNTLVPLIRARLNLTSLTTISDAEIRLFVKSSLASLYEKIANVHRDFYAKVQIYSFAANTDSYPLPADFRSAIETFVVFGTLPNVQRLPLDRFTMARYQSKSLYTSLSSQWPTMYRIMGNKILFVPCPSAAYTNAVEFWYVPQWTAPATDDSSIDVQMPNGWETWVEYDTCVQVAMRMRQPEYYAMYSKERDKVEPDIIAAAAIRDEQPEYMTDYFDAPYIGINVPGE